MGKKRAREIERLSDDLRTSHETIDDLERALEEALRPRARNLLPMVGDRVIVVFGKAGVCALVVRTDTQTQPMDDGAGGQLPGPTCVTLTLEVEG
jgi:hypothetical protein